MNFHLGDVDLGLHREKSGAPGHLWASTEKHKSAAAPEAGPTREFAFEAGMVGALKLRQEGDSVSATLPKATADRLRLAPGNRVSRSSTGKGFCYSL